MVMSAIAKAMQVQADLAPPVKAVVVIHALVETLTLTPMALNTKILAARETVVLLAHPMTVLVAQAARLTRVLGVLAMQAQEVLAFLVWAVASRVRRFASN